MDTKFESTNCLITVLNMTEKCQNSLRAYLNVKIKQGRGYSLHRSNALLNMIINRAIL